MKKVGSIAGGIVLGLFILGAGCADQAANEPAVKDAGAATVELNTDAVNQAGEVSANVQVVQPKTEDGLAIITLKGDPIGDGKVNFSWATAEKMDESNSLILVRSDKENPEHTGKNRWYRLYYARTETMWGDQPAGTWHYRICITGKASKDTCLFYSNDVAVEVK